MNQTAEGKALPKRHSAASPKTKDRNISRQDAKKKYFRTSPIGGKSFFVSFVLRGEITLCVLCGKLSRLSEKGETWLSRERVIFFLG
jgi:hypothetical protein